MKVLDGKVALITGGASGIGKSSAFLFAREGAKVAIADLDEQMGEKTAKLAKENNLEIQYIHVDVSNTSDLERMVKETIRMFGKLNIFWHNAGNAGPGVIERTTEEDFDKTIAIHMKGGFFGAKYCIPEIKKAGGGSILFTGSTAALKPSKGSPTYSMAKASLVMLTRCLAGLYAKDNIRVNCICPGSIETPMLQAFWNRDPDIISPEVYRKATLELAPMRRLGKPEEIAQTALFLVSDAASFTTGTIMSVDGGFNAL
jgi:NAD(P)-dependent dehydrogenase (short-subunit alcohol dehydrogenase family)